MNGDIKIGKLLCDEDIITKRQLNKALQRQVKGDKRTLGEILVDLGFCDFDDITNALLNHDSDTEKHEEKHEEIFEAFKQSDNSLKRSHGGAGLGLAISKKLSEIMDGDLKLLRSESG